MDATDLAFAGVARQAELLRAGEVSPRELVEASLRRIERLDPDLNAFRKVLHDRALAEADQAAARLRAGEQRPLLGVPVAVKDDMAVGGERLTFGSNAFGGPEREDAEIVRRLRAAGAIVVGITNVPELMIFPQTESATYGITRNPWDLQRTPGGSSGGSAAAVAAGLVAAATASDGGGSIRIPAGWTGLVGLKPQRDRIPHGPEGGTWRGLSVVGALTRTVEDAALVYEALTGNPYAAAAGREPGRLRIAVSAPIPPPVIARVEPQVRGALEHAAETLRSLGHEVTERAPDLGTLGVRFVARWLRGIHDDARSLAHPGRLEPRTRQLAALGALVGERGVRWARGGEAADAARINAIFADVDVLLTPTAPVLPYAAGRLARSGIARAYDAASRAVPFMIPWNHLGNPAIAVPAGVSAEGLPLSVQLVGPPHGEEVLLSLAAQLERAQPWAGRRPAIAA